MNTYETPTMTEQRPATEPCPLCGTELPRNAHECNRCDWVRKEPDPEKRPPNPRDMAAAILSVIPGAGHMFKGHMAMGALIMAGIPVIGIAAFMFTMFFGWFLVPVYWIAFATDAYLRKDLTPPPEKPSTPIPLNRENKKFY